MRQTIYRCLLTGILLVCALFAAQAQPGEVKIIQPAYPGEYIWEIRDENNPTYPGDYMWETSYDGQWYSPADYLGNDPVINPGPVFDNTIFRYTRLSDNYQGYIAIVFPAVVGPNQTIRQGGHADMLSDQDKMPLYSSYGFEVQYQWEFKPWYDNNWYPANISNDPNFFPIYYLHDDLGTVFFRRKMIINWQDAGYSNIVALKVIPELTGKISLNTTTNELEINPYILGIGNNYMAKMEYVWQYRSSENDDWQIVKSGSFTPVPESEPERIQAEHTGWYRFGVKLGLFPMHDFDLMSIGSGVENFCNYNYCPENWWEDPWIAEQYNPFIDYIYTEPVIPEPATSKYPGVIGYSQVLGYNQFPKIESIIPGSEGDTYQWYVSYDNQYWNIIPGATGADYSPVSYISNRANYYRRGNGKDNFSNVICAQSTRPVFSNENHIISYSPYRAANELDPSKALTSVVYYDGLGRPMQEVTVNGTTLGNDLVRPIVYDALGREATTYLPYERQNNKGGYTPNSVAINEQQQKYSNQYGSPAFAYNYVNYEASPLSRIMSQLNSGNDSGIIDKEKTGFEYGTNRKSEVILWLVSDNGQLINGGHYAPNQLYVARTILPENLATVEYKDKSGRVIETRTESLDPMIQQVHATSYVYDDLGRLHYVIPPKAHEVGQSSGEFEALIYRYNYDNQGRMTTKKLPDSDEHHMIYDNRDRLVMSQDGSMRERNQWTIYLYDILNRSVANGTGTTTLSRNELEALFKNTNFNQTLNGSNYTLNLPGGINFTAGSLLNSTYYDNYNWLPGSDMNFNSHSGYASDYNQNVRGQVTGIATKVLDGNQYSNNARSLYTVTYYDDKYRAVQIRKHAYLKNDNGLTVINTAYAFDGNIDSIHEYQKVKGIGTNTTMRYMYDHLRRPVAVYHKTDNKPETLLTSTVYDELGRAETKHMGSDVQIIDYEYNIRNWLTGINAGKNDSKLNAFSMELYYNTLPDIPHGSSRAYYNGNVSVVGYRHNHSDSIKNTPEFTVFKYDAFSRMLSGSNGKKIAGTTIFTGHYEENVKYDNNGNITYLGRLKPVPSDKLPYFTKERTIYSDYRYQGNRLMGLNDGTDLKTYAYDANGNMTHDGLRNLNITYNELNLPQKVSDTLGNTLEYIYSSTGEKLAKKLNGEITQYYVGSMVYNADGEPEYIIHPEGMVRKTSNDWVYQFNLTDHLGNVRVVVDENRNVLQHTDYFPFGLAVNTNNLNINKYLYNGKELQDELLGGKQLDWLDYGARNYDATIGRWSSIDPLAEKSRRWSPYVYCFNNPLKFVDPDGMEGMIYVVNLQKKNTINPTALVEQANEIFRGMGLNTTVALAPDGKDFNPHYLDDTDSYVALGSKDDISSFVADKDPLSYESTVKNWSGNTALEKGEQHYLYKSDFIGIDAEATSNFAQNTKEGISAETFGGFLIAHAAGHNATLNHTENYTFSKVNDKNGLIMTSGAEIAKALSNFHIRGKAAPINLKSFSDLIDRQNNTTYIEYMEKFFGSGPSLDNYLRNRY